jgi:hypothetical protein
MKKKKKNFFFGENFFYNEWTMKDEEIDKEKKVFYPIEIKFDRNRYSW